MKSKTTKQVIWISAHKNKWALQEKVNTVPIKLIDKDCTIFVKNEEGIIIKETSISDIVTIETSMTIKDHLKAIWYLIFK